MYRKSLTAFLFVMTVVFAASVTASAQTFILRGRVELRGADGNVAPLTGATIDAFRVDTNGKAPPATTGKKGEFNIVLQAGGQYMLAASAPGAAPKVISSIRSNRANEDFVFTLEAGDGKRYTLEEAVQMSKGGGPADSGSNTASTAPKELTPEQKKAQEDYEKKKKAYDEEKTKVEASNKTIDRTFKEGNAAIQAKNYDVAIAKYDEGIAADPVFLGSVPSLMNNKSLALQLRGGDRYNASVKAKDDALKAQAKEDLTNSYDSAKKVYDMVTTPAALADTQFAASLAKGKMDSMMHMAEALRLLTTSKLDTARGEDIGRVYREILALSTFPADKKSAYQLTMAELLMNTGDCDGANAEYQKILAGDPGNIDALAGTGLCMVAYAGDDKVKIQEGLNVLQQYVDAAPDTHKYKADAVQMISYYKNDHKMTPVKTKPAPRRKP